MGWRELFAQWNTKTLGGSTKLGVSDYELITDGVHVEVDNLAALEAKNTVGQATNNQSQSGPIEMETFQETITSGGYVNAKPSRSGIYQLQAVGAVATNMSGTSKWGLYYGTESDQTLLQWFYMTSTDSSIIFTADSNYPDMPMFYSKDCWLTVREYGSGTYDSMEINVVFAKVR